MTAISVFLSHTPTGAYLEDEIRWPEWQTLSRLGGTMHSVGFHLVTLWINLHLRHYVVELHVFLANCPASFGCFDAFP